MFLWDRRYGLSVHVKLYPVIYGVPMLLYMQQGELVGLLLRSHVLCFPVTQYPCGISRLVLLPVWLLHAPATTAVAGAAAALFSLRASQVFPRVLRVCGNSCCGLFLLLPLLLCCCHSAFAAFCCGEWDGGSGPSGFSPWEYA